jgi:hypothetical protein
LEERDSNARAITWKVPLGWWIESFVYVVCDFSVCRFLENGSMVSGPRV